MLKPIVSMNQMAMNESIATTCCYTWNGNVTGAANVLHGGKLDVKRSYYYVYPGTESPASAQEVVVSSGWLNVPVVPVGADNYARVSDTPVPYKSAGDWYYGEEAITTNNCNYEVDKSRWYFTDPTTYYVKLEDVKKRVIKHVGSTSAHYKWTSGNEWLADHAAARFSS